MLSRIASRLRRRHGSDRTRATHLSRRLEFHAETLETRQMLAGNVTAMVTVDGDLVIRGDNLSNHIEIEAQGNQIHIQGQNGTTINGEDELVIDQPSGEIDINLRNGDNVLQIRNVQSFADFTIRTGGGDDTVVVENLFAQADFTILTRAGDDLVTVDTPSIRGEFNVVMAGGNDQLLWESGFTSIRASVNLGAGSDRLILANGAAAGGDLTIRTGGGDDYVGFGPDGVELFGFTDIGMGGGNDTLILDTPVFYGLAKIRGNGGRGDEVLTQSSVELPAETEQFEASLTVDDTDSLAEAELDQFRSELAARAGEDEMTT